jgi:hypothetical protein
MNQNFLLDSLSSASSTPKRCPNALNTERQKSMIKLKHPKVQPPVAIHAHNNVDRPQNKHLKPFRSRAELGGKLDPRINVRGRPKIIFEETAQWLQQKDDRGITNARTMVASIGKLACSGNSQSVAAFKAISETIQSAQEQPGVADHELARIVVEALMNRRVPEDQPAAPSNERDLGAQYAG